MTLAPGTWLGPYEILGLLGVGGMGEVYRASDPRLGREVALKILPASVAADATQLAQFEREARAAAALNHPNIVTLHSLENVQDIRFLTMELVQGRTLESELRSGGLPLPQLFEVAVSLAEAIVAAHARGIVHRDLKPANVMLTEDGRVKVLDFGLATLAADRQGDERSNRWSVVHDPGEDSTRNREHDIAPDTEPGDRPPAPLGETRFITGTERVVGTVPYMAPEQLLGQPIDGRADLFAFGVMLYELATGIRPFTGADLSAIAVAILRDTPVPVTNRRRELPGEFGDLVHRCLQKDPRDRVLDARDVAGELKLIVRAIDAAGSMPPGHLRSAFLPAGADAPSIAVLPFVNSSPDPDHEYFAEGLSEELLNVLAKIHGLRVSSRSSAWRFKDRDRDLAEVARRLNVSAVLDGSIRAAGEQVRITVQLVHVPTDSLLWSATYDRQLSDSFAVQDDIAESVVKNLRAALLGEGTDTGERAAMQAVVQAEVQRVSRGGGGKAESHPLYLRGRFFAARRTPEDLAKGIEILERVVATDPEHALAWVGLSHAYRWEASRGWVEAAHGYARAREAAERALALAPDLAEAHSAFGSVLMLERWDWKGADVSLQRAVALAPGSVDVLRSAAHLAWILGRNDESIALSRRVLTLDPLNPGAYDDLGIHCYTAGRWSEAEEAFHSAVELSPQGTFTNSSLGLVYLMQARLDEALRVFEREPDRAFRLQGIALVKHASGEREAADAALRELISAHHGDSAYQIAQVYSYRGERNTALDWLERAYDVRDPGMTELKVDPLFEKARDDPWWQELMQRMGLVS